MAVEAIRSAAIWVAIAGQVAEAAAWLAAWHILSDSDVQNEPMAVSVGGMSSDQR
jgi:hypothetical protein